VRVYNGYQARVSSFLGDLAVPLSRTNIAFIWPCSASSQAPAQTLASVYRPTMSPRGLMQLFGRDILHDIAPLTQLKSRMPTGVSHAAFITGSRRAMSALLSGITWSVSKLLALLLRIIILTMMVEPMARGHVEVVVAEAAGAVRVEVHSGAVVR